MKNKLSMALTLAVVLSMLAATLALADNVVADADFVAVANQSSLNLGTVAPGAILTPQVSFTLVCSGNKHVDDAQSVNLTFSLAGSTVPAGSLSATNASIGAAGGPDVGVPTVWPDDVTGAPNCGATAPLNDNGNSTVTITAPLVAGPYTYIVRYTNSFSTPGLNDPSSITTANTDVTFTLTVSAPANTPPSVSVTGVANAASYEFGFVPSAGCAVTDTEDGNSSFAATLGSISGPFSAYGLGSQTASCSYTDAGALTDTDSATYSIVDTTDPTIDPHGDETAEATGPSGANVSYTSPASHDAAFGDGVASCLPASGTQFVLGNTTVTCNASDAAGNPATSTTFVVHVVDTTAPVIDSHLDATEEATSAAGAIVNYTSPATSDAVDGAGTATCAPASGTQFVLWDTTVTCDASDAAGNPATSTTFVVHVVDTTAPVIDSHLDATEEATSAAGAIVNYTSPATSDAVDGAGTATCAPASGTQFVLGNTTVTCNASDAAGNPATSTTFVVHVVDTTAPVIDSHLDATEEATSAAGAIVNYTSPATSDAVDGAGTATCAPASGTQFVLWDTTVTCDASDAAGNPATSTTFVVHVVDTTAPVIDSHLDATEEATSAAGAIVNYTSPATSDAVDGAGTATCAPASGTQFVLGDTTVTCDASDAAGNTAISTTFVVHVVDTTAPVIDSHLDATEEATSAAGAIVNYTSPATSDAVDGAGTATCAPASGTQFVLGDTTVTCDASDAAGNPATSTTFVVHVVDTTDPTITFFSRLPVANGFGWNNTDVTVTWNCSDLVGVLASSVSQTVSSEGAGQSATGTCEDTSGNTASDTKTGINIDKTAPTGIGFSGGPAGGGSYYFGSVPAAPTCSANGAISGLDTCVVTGYSNAVGPHTMTATATDKAGNASTATRSYTVLGWTLNGFYQPVDMNNVVNTVKGGSTVPLKFEVFGATELTDTAIVSTLLKQVTCNATAEDTIEVLATGGTSLRYDTTGGQFIFNWQTPKLPGKCYSVTLTTQDGSSITAFFKLK